jgi:hypothetical protein
MEQNRGSSLPAALTQRKKQPQQAGKEASTRARPDGGTLRIPSIPVGEVLSFLKETRGAVTWTAQEMIDALKLSRQDAEQPSCNYKAM